MTDIPIRLSPSGPVIATLAAGAMLRLAENRATAITAVAQVAESPFGSGLRAFLLKPSASKLYRIEAECDLLNEAAITDQTITAVLQVSYDNAATWVTVETQVLTLQHQSQLHVHPRFKLGALPSFPATPPASVIADITLQKSAVDLVIVNAANGEDGGTGWLSISEHVS